VWALFAWGERFAPYLLVGGALTGARSYLL
jgi:hypothetical protein